MTMSILSTAASGLRLTQTLLGTTARNISNASTEGYTRKVQEAVTAPGGVVASTVRRSVDNMLTQELNRQISSRSGAQTLATALSRVDRIAGDPQRTDSLSGRMSALADSLQQLATDPTAPSSYQEVIDTANSLAATFRDTFYELNGISRDAKDAIPADVAGANDLINQIATINRQVASLGARGTDDTELLDKRDKLVGQLSETMTVRSFVDQRNVLHVYSGDNKLLADENATQLTTDLSGNVLSGTERLYNIGGRIGMNQDIINRVIPSFNQQLDDLAGRLTEGMDAVGVPLFNDGGTIPFDPTNPAQTSGYSGRIQLNQAVDADSSLLRGGTAVAIGDTSLIVAARAVLIADDQTFTAAGLPSTGTLTLAAGTFVGNIASRVATANDDVAGRQVAEDLVRSRAADVSDVDVEQEMARMIQLQNAYAANARVIQTAQSMMDELLNLSR